MTDPSCKLNLWFLCPSIAIPDPLPISAARLQALLVGPWSPGKASQLPQTTVVSMRCV